MKALNPVSTNRSLKLFNLHENSIKKNPDAQAIPPRVEVEQKEGRGERIKRIVCFRCGERAHYANRCPTKRKKTRSRDLALYCLKCGEDGHLASWCEKENDN